jgi:hypothetical protein
MKLNIKFFQWRRVGLLSATFFCIFFALVACEKTDSLVGAGVYDGLLDSDGNDTFAINTYTITEDSIFSRNPIFAMLGSYNDPVFGKFDASFYSQFRLQTLSPAFEVDAPVFVIDSVVLGLEHRVVADLDFKGYYGKTDAQTVEVYRMNEVMYNDSLYYGFTTFETGVENLVQPGKEVITPRPNTRTIIGNDTLSPQLRIHLKPSFGMQLVQEAVNNPTSYASNEAFLEFFNGLHVKVNNGSQPSGNGGAFNFNLNAANSKMTIYFRQNDDTLRYDFIINNNCVKVNHVDVDNAGTAVQNVINNPIAGNNLYYAQAFRSRAVMEFPTVTNIPPTAVVHKATLIIPVSYESGKIYYPSEAITILTKITDTSTRYANIQINGFYDDNLKAYIINMRDYFQKVVKGQYANRGLYLSPSLMNASAERIIFNGKDADLKKKPKLVLTYTSY